MVRVYLHTLKITTGGGQTLLPVSKDYRPGRDRSRHYMLELALLLPQAGQDHWGVSQAQFLTSRSSGYELVKLCL